MPTIFTEKSYVRPAVVFAACLLATLLLPLPGMWLSAELLFFAPQLLFPYGTLVTPHQYHGERVLSENGALLMHMLQWGLAGACFVFLGKRLKVVYAVLAGVLWIALVGFTTNLIFGCLGMSVQLDGP
jgi:hypothetical protein